MGCREASDAGANNDNIRLERMVVYMHLMVRALLGFTIFSPTS